MLGMIDMKPLDDNRIIWVSKLNLNLNNVIQSEWHFLAFLDTDGLDSLQFIPNTMHSIVLLKKTF